MEKFTHASWSEAIVDSYNQAEKKVTMVFNFNFQNKSLYNFYLGFVVSYFKWIFSHYSLITCIECFFDVRGQDIKIETEEMGKYFRDKIGEAPSVKIKVITH